MAGKKKPAAAPVASGSFLPTEIEHWPIAKLIPYARNARTHTPEQVAEIAGSIREYGWTNPVLVDEVGEIIAGHGRVLAAYQLHMEVVPVIVLSHLSDVQKRRIRIADNRIALNAGWDEELLAFELKGIAGAGGEVTGLGFAEDELRRLMADSRTGRTEPDDVPEVLAKPVARLGDVWILGAHRLVCGDSTDASVVAKLLGPAKPVLMVTDPPYGVEYDPSWREQAGLAGSGIAKGKVKNDNQASWRRAYALFPGDIAYVWHASAFASIVEGDLVGLGWEIRAQIIWAKTSLVISRGHYHWQHEPCQPAGTMVRTPDGVVPIERLVDGDRVVSYDSKASQITGLREGRAIKVARRDYDGDLYHVSVGARTTRTTDGHQFTVRFDPAAADVWCSYLMRRGEWWRVGIARLFNSRGFGLSVRLMQEGGDEAWLLATHASKADASCAEQVFSCGYGIPTTHWATDRNEGQPSLFRSPDQIAGIYNRLDLRKMRFDAHRLLADHGRRPEYPLVTGDSIRHSRRITTRVRACNLMPRIMQLPVPSYDDAGRRGVVARDGFAWETISKVGMTSFEGVVYSLDVDVDHHYVADGIVTHNCWYAVRKGKTAGWLGNRKQSTLWKLPLRARKGEMQLADAESPDVPGIVEAEMNGQTGFFVRSSLWTIDHRRSETGHGTQKPVEAMRRPIVNHTSGGHGIYDPFSGSGTTIIACEVSQRVGYAIELDPLYVDVAIRRWQDYTGQEAIHEESRFSFTQMAKHYGVELGDG